MQAMFRSSKIVRIVEYSEDENEIITIMEFIKDAGWLEKKIEERKREIKNEAKLKHIAREVLLGLQRVHAASFIHADIKI